MMGKLSYDELNELLPAYAMGALEPDEMLAVDDALSAYPELEVRLQELDVLGAEMGRLSSALPVPPTAVYNTLMRQAKANIAQPPPISQHPPQRKPWWQQGLFSNGWRLAAALALLVVIFTAVSRLDDLQTIETLREQMADMDAQVAELEAVNGRLQEQLRQEQETLASLTNANQILALTPTDSAPNASGEFYRSADEITLVVRALTPPPEEKAYYLWGVVLGPNDEKTFTNLGTVPLNDDGSFIFSYTVPDGDSQYDVIDVSLEDQSEPPPPILEGDIVLRGLIETDDEG